MKGALPLSYEGAYVSNCKTLSWMGNNTKKMRPRLSISTAATATAPPSAVAASDALAMDSFPPASFGPIKGAQKQPQQAGTFSYASAASKAAATTPAVSTSAVLALGKQMPSKQSITPSPGTKGQGAEGDVECWTLTSTREFGAANKVTCIRNTYRLYFTT